MYQSKQSFLQGPYSSSLFEATANDLKTCAHAAYCFPCATANLLKKANPHGNNPHCCVIGCIPVPPLWTLCADRETKKACNLPEEQNKAAPFVKALCCAPCFIAQQNAELDQAIKK